MGKLGVSVAVFAKLCVSPETRIRSCARLRIRDKASGVGQVVDFFSPIYCTGSCKTYRR